MLSDALLIIAMAWVSTIVTALLMLMAGLLQ
jgi:hypothetical protein